MVQHDATLARTAGENINVTDATLETLQGITLFDKDKTKDRADLRPTCLENYLKIAKRYEKHCVLELKSDFTQDEINRIIDIVKSYDYLENLTFISFCYDNLVRVRSVLPKQSAQFLFGQVTEEIFERVVKDKIDVDVFFRELTEENIRRFHGAGLKVNCWTVDSKEDAEKLVAMGVDFITSNILE